MTKKLIEEISPETWERIYALRDYIRERASCTDPADRPTTERCITEIYSWAGFGKPKFRWFDGPLTVARESKKLNPEQTGLPRFFYGIEDMHWVAWLLGGEMAGAVYPVDLRARLQTLYELYLACGWWVALEGLVLCAERHERICFDDEYRLHSASGPAIRCRDGLELYAWHGTRIPGEWINDSKSIDPSTALTWPNTEQRRCAAEIIGWDRVLEQLDCKVIDEHKDPQIGTLLEVELPDIGRQRFLRAECGTGRMVVIPVPPDVETPLDAQMWSYDTDDPSDIVEREIRT